MTGDEDVAVAEPLLRVADIPAHEAAECEGDEHMPLRARAAGMAALAVVLEDVNKVVNAVADFLPVREMLREFVVPGTQIRLGGNGHRATSFGAWSAGRLRPAEGTSHRAIN